MVFITGRNEVVAKVIFLHLSVILFTGGGVSASVHAGIPPPRSRHLPGSRYPEQTHPPWSRHPLEQTPLGADTPPRADNPPGADTPLPPPKQPPPGADTPREADSSIRSMSGL